MWKIVLFAFKLSYITLMLIAYISLWNIDFAQWNAINDVLYTITLVTFRNINFIETVMES